MKFSLTLLAVALSIATLVFSKPNRQQLPDPLVSIEVTDQPLATVIPELERISGRRIYCDKTLIGAVSLAVVDEPLSLVLKNVAEQVGAFSAAIYQIHQTSKSAAVLQNWFVSGASELGWTNATSRFGAEVCTTYYSDLNLPEPTVSISAVQAPVARVASILSERVGAHVLVEDGISKEKAISLHLMESPPDDAVARFARILGNKYSRFYIIRSKPFELQMISAAGFRTVWRKSEEA
jgi:type II secretory pathway component GspD/PulD (secretin)